MKIVIPMAGLGSRFKNINIQTPKPLIDVNGKTLIEHSITSLGISGQYIFITREYENKIYNEQLSGLLKSLVPDSIEIRLNKNQIGAADAALYAKDYINDNEQLIITNCDQRLDWDSKDFIDFVNNTKCDGAVVIFKSHDPKNSFAKILNNRVIEVAEKKVISNYALFGLHYWKHGKDFVQSAEKLLKEYKQKGLNECYVSETYNYLVENKNILGYLIKNNQYHLLGTPQDIEIYLSKTKEYYTEKPKTIFCDIDGTIIKHAHRFSHIGVEEAEALSGVLDKFNEWDTRGHTIVLTTARKESARTMTEIQLSKLGFCWDYLIMGVTSGERILINDKLKNEDPDRAVSINVITDEGFLNYDWKSIGL
jgi:NDP-sugar pyrophosphorylase family protein